MEVSEIVSYATLIGMLVGAVLGYGKLQSATKVLQARREEDKTQMEKELQAVKISKHSSIKEMKADLRERIEICHDRIDKQREHIDKHNEKIDTKLDELKKHVDDSNARVIETVTTTIGTAFAGMKGK